MSPRKSWYSRVSLQYGLVQTVTFTRFPSASNLPMSRTKIMSTFLMKTTILSTLVSAVVLSGCATRATPSPTSTPKSVAAANGVESESSVVYAMHVFEAAPIFFPPGSAVAYPDSDQAITKAVQWMKLFEDAHVEVHGHTDNRGTQEESFSLGQERADYVAARLISAGIAPSQIVTVTRGQHAPLSPNDTPENRALNRRMELRMTPISYCTAG